MRQLRAILTVLALLLVIAASAQGQQRQNIGPVVVEGFKTLTITDESVTLTGPLVKMQAKDGSIEAKAQSMVITFGPGGPQGGVGSLRTAKLTGNVWLRTEPEKGKSTVATCDSAFVDYATKQEAVMAGAVTIKSTDPSMFVGPAVVTGDRATVSLKRTLQPGEARIRIESSPEKSRLEFTPRPQEKDSEQKQIAD